MFGDPTTTPGGKAIPFHSSVRIKLGAGQRIENKEKEVIGIHVSAKTIKNKVAPPFRTAKFEIHFGKGIKEHEQLFDLLRKHGSTIFEGHQIEISGTSAWKKLEVTNITSGEIIIEKKFYKADFDQIVSSPEYSKYVEALVDDAMIRKMNDPNSASIDPESYEEVKSIAMDLENEFFDPEG